MNPAVCGVVRLIQRSPCTTNWLRARHALYVPDVKAGNVKLRPESARGNTLHDRLSFCYRVPAAVAGLPIAGAVPDTWHSVLRKTALIDLPVDQKSKHGGVHVMASRCGSDWDTPDSPGSRRQWRQPEGQGAGELFCDGAHVAHKWTLGHLRSGAQPMLGQVESSSAAGHQVALPASRSGRARKSGSRPQEQALGEGAESPE
jgi:hypothetical protein